MAVEDENIRARADMRARADALEQEIAEYDRVVAELQQRLDFDRRELALLRRALARAREVG